MPKMIRAAFQAAPHEPVVAQAERPRRFACQQVTTTQTFTQRSKFPAIQPYRRDKQAASAARLGSSI